jgi:aarF domain-containing kinase
VIEGIALRVDPDYSIVQECFPYIARRLLADDDPRVRKALRDVLYGNKQRLDVERLIRLADAFSAFTTDGLAEGGAEVTAAAGAAAGVPAASSSSSSSVWSGSTPTPVAARRQLPAAAAAAPTSSSSGTNPSRERLSPAAKEALLLVFAPQGSYMQELLVEELVAAVDALSREAASELLRRVLGSAPAVVALSSIEALGPLRPLVLPVPTPLELLSKLVPAVAVGPEDEEALGTLRGVFQLLQRVAPGAALTPGGFGPSSSSSSAGGSPVAAAADAVVSFAQVASELRPILPELLPGLAHTGQLFVRTFIRRAALRVAETVSVGDEYDQAMAAVGFMPWGLPNAGAAPGGSSGLGPLGGLVPGGGLPGSSNQFGYASVNYQQQQGGQEGFSMAGNPSSTPPGVKTADWAVRQSARVRAARNRRRGTANNTTSKSTSSTTSSSSQKTQNVSAEQQPGGGEGYAQLPSAGQVVTALLAAPLLMVFTPLALLSQHQQYEQQRRDSKWL